jgi:hypothetical protein
MPAPNLLLCPDVKGGSLYLSIPRILIAPGTFRLPSSGEVFGQSAHLT